MIDRARAELTVLAPGWRPDVGTGPGTGRSHPRPGPAPADELAAVPAGRLHGPCPERRPLPAGSRPGSDHGHPRRLPAQRGRGPRAIGAMSSTGSPTTASGRTWIRMAGPDVVATETAHAAVALIRDLRPSVLQPTSNHLNGQVALALGARFGLPVVYEVRGFLEETWLSRMGPAAADSDRYLAARAVETAVMDAADAVVTLSETMRVDILSRSAIAPDRVVVVPNGVDVDAVRAGAARRGPRRIARDRPGRDRHRLHLQLHVVRGHRLPDPGGRPAARARPSDPAAAGGRRRGPGGPGGRRPRGGPRRRHGDLHRPRPAR